MRLARQAGFENLNLDLIYGIMGQTLPGWQDTLRRVLDLAPDHLSLYALTLETGTPMQARVETGGLPAPDPDAAADMYEWAREELERLGYRHYEISNWARDEVDASGTVPSRACRHNLLTWRLEPYLGLGAGAHGSIPGLRYANVRHPSAYIRRMQTVDPGTFPLSAAAVETWPIDPETERRERMMLGLRLVEEGVDEASYLARFGSSVAHDFGPTLTDLANLGLVEWQAGRLRLTRARTCWAIRSSCTSSRSCPVHPGRGLWARSSSPILPHTRVGTPPCTPAPPPFASWPIPRRASPRTSSGPIPSRSCRRSSCLARRVCSKRSRSATRNSSDGSRPPPNSPRPPPRRRASTCMPSGGRPNAPAVCWWWHPRATSAGRCARR